MQNIVFDTLFLGKPFVFLPSCQSTNSILADLSVNDSFFEGTTVLALEQTAGRGQQGNTWTAEPGKNLTFSVLLRPKFLTASKQFALNMAVSLGIQKFLTFYLGTDVRIKWPNDLLCEGKKICGILIENVLKKNDLERSVVGIGVNVNQIAFEHPHATSFFQQTGQGFSLEELIKRLMLMLEHQYLRLKNGDLPGIEDEYLQCLFRFGETALYKIGEENLPGLIRGIDPYGKLLLETEKGLQAYGFKEVFFLY